MRGREAEHGASALDAVPADALERGWRTRAAAAGAAWRVLVAERDGAVVGFCALATPARDADSAVETAELTAIYVDPDHWRTGVGTALLDAALDGLRRDGWPGVTLRVLERNARGLAFYARLGFVADGARQELDGLDRTEIRLRRALR